MQLAIMRFGGMNLPHNPKTLKIAKSKKISSINLLGGESKVSGISDGISKISGIGELYGEDCFMQYERLLRLHFQNKAEVLAIPEVGAFKAVLSDITLLAEPKNNVISLSFEFQAVNDDSKGEKISENKYCTALKNESLWDISYRCNTTIEKLIELNPQIRNIMELSVGEEVRIS